MTRPFLALVLCVLMGVGALRPATAQAPAQTSQTIVDELVAADRAFGEAARDKPLAEGLSAMFDSETVMPSPAGFITGPAAIAAALNANPANDGAKASWTPVRGGVSADGSHGFTIGFMTIVSEGKPVRHAKYVSYWIKRPSGWKVAVYKRGGRPNGEVSLALMAPSLPEQALGAAKDAATLAAYRASLDKAERSFSDDAQVIGIGPAFVKYGRADATNVGFGPNFTVGNDKIGADIGANPVEGGLVWAPDGGVIVAPTGDFGITWGMIRPLKPDAGVPATIPYTTIWRRAAPDQPWRYIAE